jgi:uncharacterized protein (DUF2252 family)
MGGTAGAGTGASATAVALLDPLPASLTPAERAACGRSARSAVPRSSHARYEPAADRPDPIALLEQQAAGRVPALLPIRYGRMLASPFAFLRGAALPMASDLAATPSTGLTVQACGDAHLSNFGIFASPERRLVFDINDFDETLPAPWEWDIKRLAVSAEVAARGNGLRHAQRLEIVRATVGRYRATMRRLAGLGSLDVWYLHTELDELRAQYQAILDKPERRLAGEDLAWRRGEDSMRAFAKLTRLVDGAPRIAADPPLLVPLAAMPAAQARSVQTQLTGIITSYQRTLQSDRQFLLSRFRVADIARQVVGIGSVGLRCWIILLLGSSPSDRLFLQVKEAEPAAGSAFAGASAYASQGERVVAGQRLMQAASDIFLGWYRAGRGARGRSGDFYVRQLRDWKYSPAVSAMSDRTMRLYGELCAGALARAHARSGDRIAIAAYLGSSTVFDTAIAEFASAYADENEHDYACLAAAVRAGRIAARKPEA